MIGVIGDIILDKYIHTSSVRNSPECETAPVGVVYNYEYKLGGAANVALNIMKLGLDVKLFGACSDTKTLELIHGNKIPTSLNSTANSIIKTRIYVNDVYYIRVDEESTIKHDEQRLIKSIGKEYSTIVVSDYNKGTVTDFAGIRKSGARTIVDVKSNFNKYRGAYILKPNIKEYYAEIGVPMSKNIEYAVSKILSSDQASDLLDKLDIGYMVITAGPAGAILVGRDNITQIPTIEVPVVDVTGAGDTFIAALAVAIEDENISLTQAVEFANLAAAVSVTKRGTSYVNRNEI